MTDISANTEGDLSRFKTEILKLSMEIVDRDLAEVSRDISFVDEQLKTDLQGYSTEELRRAFEKVSALKRKRDLLKEELAARAS